jgi:hypothetical protein
MLPCIISARDQAILNVQDMEYVIEPLEHVVVLLVGLAQHAMLLYVQEHQCVEGKVHAAHS